MPTGWRSGHTGLRLIKYPIFKDLTRHVHSEPYAVGGNRCSRSWPGSAAIPATWTSNPRSRAADTQRHAPAHRRRAALRRGVCPACWRRARRSDATLRSQLRRPLRSVAGATIRAGALVSEPVRGHLQLHRHRRVRLHVEPRHPWVRRDRARRVPASGGTGLEPRGQCHKSRLAPAVTRRLRPLSCRGGRARRHAQRRRLDAAWPRGPR